MAQVKATRGSIGFLVDRLHVSTSNREILREMWRRMLPKVQHSRSERKARHGIYREALRIHRENQELYRDVMNGRI